MTIENLLIFLFGINIGVFIAGIIFYIINYKELEK